jgi:peptidoglycan hydrolase-like amidase
MKLRTFVLILGVSIASTIFNVGGLGQKSQNESLVLEEEFIRSKVIHGSSHASGGRTELGPVNLGNPSQVVTALRVGIHYSYNAAGAYSEFASLNHPMVRVGNTEGAVFIMDQATGQQIGAIMPMEFAEITFANTTGYTVMSPAGTVTVVGPIRFAPQVATNQFRIESIRRSNPLVAGSPQTIPLYRGTIEVSRGSATAADRLNVMNILDVEEYVRGVVANESIASFHMEALKAQATAARGYSIANIGNYIARGYPFDIVDSSASQVYRGVISEHVRAVQATEETRGLVASYHGQIITAFYSSSFGGYSDSNHWIFNTPSSQLPGTNVTPYLTGIYDGEGAPPDLTTDPGRQAFWMFANQAFSYDMCGRVNNRFARWRITIPASDIKARLTPARIVVISGDTTGDITGIEVLQRMTGSNRIASIRITLTTGVVEVRGWDNLRNVIGRTRSGGTSPVDPCTGTVIAANFTLTNPAIVETVTNAGIVESVISTGGGWGHNVGMSQYGSHGRGLAGQNFLQILTTYYQGVDIGSYPLPLGNNAFNGQSTPPQIFYAPNAAGTLVIRSTPELRRLRVQVNEHQLEIAALDLADGFFTMDISPYLTMGLNTVTYTPLGRSGNSTANVNVY